MRAKGYSLPIALVISAVIAIFLTVALMFFGSNQLLVQDAIQEKALEQDASSGINHLKNLKTTTHYQESFRIQGKSQRVLTVTKHPWGLFDVGIATAECQEGSVMKTALLGAKEPEDRQTALYLKNRRAPLKLGGGATIRGDVYHPKAGIQKFHAYSSRFRGDYTIQGDRYISQMHFPWFDETLIDQIYQGFREVDRHPIPGDSIEHPFSRPTKNLSPIGENTLAGITLKGNIRVIADRPLTIRKSANLEDVIVYAPAIKVAPGFKGSLQIFVSDSAKLEGCELHYPSVIGLYNQQKTPKHQPKVAITGNTVFEGTILARASGSRAPKVKVGNKVDLTGEVFADGNLSFQGDMAGRIYCDRLIYDSPTKHYKNLLVDATIDATKLPATFAFSRLTEHKVQSVAKWLF